MQHGLLYNELKESDQKLAEEFDAIYQEALNIWNDPALRTFTEHGQKHTLQVERNLDMLTRPLQRLPVPQNTGELTGPLKPYEIFVLLSACCLHDIGMQLDNSDARERHAEYACNLILHSSARINFDFRRVTLQITDDNAREAIALVARAHWTDYALDLERYDNRIYNNQRGRLPLLGVLLAMADLLDLSPVRASYFRTLHRLYELTPLAWLHQTMHARVKGCEILPPDENGELQFELVWRDGVDRNDIRNISDWVMTWFNSQWRLLKSALIAYSGGYIRWTEPWFEVKFTESLIPLELEKKQLTEEARRVLRAERIDQRRINRDKFIENFKKALKDHETVLFLIPWESDLDGGFICDWCEAYAATITDCKVATVTIKRSLPTSLSGIISELMKGWQEECTECDDKQALASLSTFLSTDKSRHFLSIIVSDNFRMRELKALLEALMQRPSDHSSGARLCLLRTPESYSPKKLKSAKVITFHASQFSQDEIQRHMKIHFGYPEKESLKIYQDKLLKLPNSHKPMMMYDYIETLYGFPSNKD